ncbi:MAG: glycosyltransferase [Gemmatimonadales bacterium]
MPPESIRPTRRLHVVHVVFDLHGGGMETLVADLARRFQGRVDVSVVSLSGRAGRVGTRIQPLLHEFHVLRPLRGLSLLAPVGLVRCLRAIKPDVVHAHSGAWFKAALAARLAGVPRVVYTEHGREHHDPVPGRWLDRLAASLTDTVIAVSDRLSNYLHTVIGVPFRKLRTVANGVDVLAFSNDRPPSSLRLAFGIEPHARIIGSVGRLQPVKSYHHLIEALALLRTMPSGSDPIHLILVGDGPERERLERLAAELGVSSVVHFAGWTQHPVDCYRLFDVFALTSRSEGAPVSLMEAMACGIVPVVTGVGANAEILGPELAHQLVNVGDVPAIAEALRTALTTCDRLRLGALARRRIVGNYNLDQLVTQYESAYRGMQVVGDRPGISRASAAPAESSRRTHLA